MGLINNDVLMLGIREAVEQVLTAGGVEKHDATACGLVIADNLRQAWVRNIIHIPFDISYKRMQRNKQIFEAFDGSNHSKLAKDHKMSVQAIYRIVKQMRADYIRRLQPDMFTDQQPVDDKNVKKYATDRLHTLADIIDYTTDCLRSRLHINNTLALELGEQVADYMSTQWGGQSIYIKSIKKEDCDDKQHRLSL